MKKALKVLLVVFALGTLLTNCVDDTLNEITDGNADFEIRTNGGDGDDGGDGGDTPPPGS